MATPHLPRAGVTGDEELAGLRRRGFAVAYRMLGSVAEAEDVAQEALLRLSDRGPAAPEEPVAWITTVATRLSIDHLRLARVRRETYVGPWLPEPLVTSGPGPQERLEQEEAVSLALLAAMERLTPLERAAFLLREVFDYDYGRIAGVLGRSEASCRQLVSRAARHLEGEPRFDGDPDHARELLERFLAASESGDLAELEALLADDVVLLGDGGGKAQSATEPVVGARAVAAFAAEIARKRRALGTFALELVSVNGQPGRVLRDDGGQVWDVLAIDVLDGRIRAVRIVRNPEKLRHL